MADLPIPIITVGSGRWMSAGWPDLRPLPRDVAGRAARRRRPGSQWDVTKKRSTKQMIGGTPAGQNGSDDAQHRREAVLAIVDELRHIRDRASELELGHVVRVIDAAIVATARQVDIEMLPTNDEDLDD